MPIRPILRRGLVLVAAVALSSTPAAAVKRRAFVTSISGTGNLSSWLGAGGLTGIAAADNVCRVRAVLGGLPNADTYRAWLSTSTTDAWCHVQGLTGKKTNGCDGAPLPGGGPWYLANGITPFTGSLSELTGLGGNIYRSALMDEYGDPTPSLGTSFLWTGTRYDGVVEGSACSDWTVGSSGVSGRLGSALGTRRIWTSWVNEACNAQRRLLCLEPGASEAATPRWTSPGALVFATSTKGTGDLGTWPEAGGESGLAAGDAICRARAAAAHLPAPESYVAWLSDDTTDAIDRLTIDAAFRRVDGLAIAFSRADLTDGATAVSLHQDETGEYGLNGPQQVWTGTGADGLAMADTCSGWTDATSASTGEVGMTALARVDTWTTFTHQDCDLLQGLYCFSNVVTIFWDGFDFTGDASRWSSVTP